MHARSVGEILDDVWIIEKSDPGSAVVAIVGSHGRKSMARPISKIFILDTCHRLN